MNQTPQFTTKSQEALSAAAMNASTANNPTIEPAHLLKALMDQRDSVAVGVLKAAGVDPDVVSSAASSASAGVAWSRRSSRSSISCRSDIEEPHWPSDISGTL